MASSDGGFVWYELITSDVDAARDFYAKVVGWTIEEAGMPGPKYWLAKVGDRAVAGLMAFPPDEPTPPVGWIGYLASDDVDAGAVRVTGAGGTIHRPPTDIPGVGRFAVVADPQGAVYVLFKGAGDPPPNLVPGTPGSIGWHELHSSDWSAGCAFYERLYGWQKTGTVDMGDMGTYQLFGTGGEPVGGMMNMPGVPPHWSYYFTVDAIDAAVERLNEAGGMLQRGPHEVPGGSWIAVATDPQGGWFSLTAPRR